jgi:hypothetical protein
MPRLLIPLAVGMLALAVQIAYGYFKLHKKLGTSPNRVGEN